MRQGFDTFMNAKMMHGMLNAKRCYFLCVYIFLSKDLWKDFCNHHSRKLHRM